MQTVQVQYSPGNWALKFDEPRKNCNTRFFLLYIVKILSVHIISKISQNLTKGNLLVGILIVRPSEISDKSIIGKLPISNHKLTIQFYDCELSDVLSLLEIFMTIGWYYNINMTSYLAV